MGYSPHHLFRQQSNQLQVTNILLVERLYDALENGIPINMERKRFKLHFLETLVDGEEVQGVISGLFVQYVYLLGVELKGVLIGGVLEESREE